ncbi:DUF6891 domain-containing protein [Streptomyces halobius]|uniref:DUF6891 domain-containing protein n=1 Tax=Streptomyces halobius TaxID=2879846 RepID=A0ABY4MDV4_9ACTN|nr:hypothetical protein [Streptomyces halobius]UQA95865.1 hypothetical protein K9S39_31930 [Streptomyces halobius]
MLPITVKTETGPVLSRPTAAELTTLLGRIGADDDHFVVVERIPEEAQRFVQTWREGARPFAVEYRDGGPDQHFRAETTDTGRVVAAFLDWARGVETWRTALDWQPADLGATPDLDPETRAAAEEQARKGIRSGFRSFHQVVQGVSDAFDPDSTPVTPEEARRIVASLWEERLAEQARWPEVTDADRVAEVFAALERQGLTARMNFGCCSRCALSEIDGERAESDHGFVFFHHQDTETVADDGGLSIRYGAYADSGRDSVEVGKAVVAALTEAGLPVEWNGTPRKVIEVTPLDWRKRLPTGA